MKKYIILFLLFPFNVNAIVVSHSEPTVNPQMKCDYSVALEGTNRTVWKCFTAEEYYKDRQQKEYDREVYLQNSNAELLGKLTNNYFLLPVGFLLLVIAIIFGGFSDFAAFMGIISIFVIILGVIRAFYQMLY